MSGNAALPVKKPSRAARAFRALKDRRMAAMLNDRTAEGYVFRTDLRLRPDPGATPVVISTEAALNYYESLGQTWERAACGFRRICLPLGWGLRAGS